MSTLDHLRKYPNARPSTLAWIALRDQKTEQLRAEIPRKRIGLLSLLLGLLRKAVK
ncbi:MAG: hypothetical protein ACT6U0_18740 [Shinella sp.]|uniref:hypothetical protein n=1 Tax=Shinella sp. TaxID=1870904 RepID=UPI004035DB08